MNTYAWQSPAWLLSHHADDLKSALERGRRNPTIVSLWELAQALGATPVDLITPDDDAD